MAASTSVLRAAALAALAVPLSAFEVARSLPKITDALVRLGGRVADAVPAITRIDANLQELVAVERSLAQLSEAVPSLQAIAAATDNLNDLARSAALLPLLSGQAQVIGDQATGVTEWLERLAPVLERLVDTVGTLERTVGVLGDTLGPIQETTGRVQPGRGPAAAGPPAAGNRVRVEPRLRLET